ncbi:MAG: hypothetical protein VKK42_19595 [Lyngbya sp.]|nr:hypothetical protein [Lyngbya sp.]
MQLSEGVIVLGISQLIAFGIFSIKVMWNYKKELGKAHQQIDELNEDLNNIANKLRELQTLNNLYIGHLQEFLSKTTDYRPPTTAMINQRKNYH